MKIQKRRRNKKGPEKKEGLEADKREENHQYQQK